MVNYANGKIYKIVPNVENADKADVYVGSTTKERLCQRMTAHRKDYNQYTKGKAEKVRSYDLFDKYGINNCSIILLENVCCETRDQLHARERYYIETILCVNKQIPGRTKKEYNDATKEQTNNRAKCYYENNKEHVLERIKIYTEDKKEQIKEYKKQYYELNKAELSEKEKQRFYNCDCGSVCRYSDKSQHFKSKKHQLYIQKIII